MPSRSGWLTLAVGILALCGARVVGYLELWVFGATAIALVIGAVALVSLGRFPLRVERVLRPSRVRAGQPGSIELRVTNKTQGRSPTVALTESVGPGPPALVHVAPLASGRGVQAAYQLPTNGRGRIQIGPLDAIMRDPLRLARRRLRVAPVAGLTVHPEPLDIDLVGSGAVGLAGPTPRSVAGGTVAFAGLREYATGDDLRRVHWRASARHGDLLVRIDDDERDAARTVVLDVRPGLHGPGRLDQAASAALAILDAGAAMGAPLRLITTTGLDTSAGTGPNHLDHCGDALAVVTESPGSLLTAIEAAANGRDDIVVVTGRIGRGDLELLATRLPHGSTVVTTGPIDTAPATLRVIELPEPPAPVAPEPAPRRRRARPPVRALGFLEASLVALTFIALMVARRVFDSWDYMIPAGVAAAFGHGAAIATRRLRWPTLPSLVGCIALGAVVCTAIRYPETSWFALPTWDTWDVAVAQVRASASSVSAVIAPVPPVEGFLTLAVVGAFAMALLADTFAIRARAALESLVPALAITAVVAVLGVEDHQVLSTTAVLAGCVLVVAAHRRWTTRAEGGWLASARRSPPNPMGVVAVAGALVAGAVIGPRLPWVDRTPLIDVEANGSPSLSSFQPMVELRGRLDRTRSDEVMLRVRTNTPAYLRLTSLDTYDGLTWTVDRSFSEAGSELADVPDGLDIEADITVVGLGGRYVPAPFTPIRITPAADVALRFDQDSSTVLVDDPDRNAVSASGLTRYQVQSVAPVPNAEQLTASNTTGAPGRYLELPDDLDPAIGQAARVAAGAGDPLEQMLNLQNYFRQFDYELGIQAPDGVDPIVWFLNGRIGYCEQFAGSFAVMARTLNIPARVALGFTPGELTANGSYEVKGKHAHAWPEVWFRNTGWVAFEPTPGRGLPAELGEYTGVEPQQVDEGPTVTEAPTSTAAPTTIAGTPTPTTTARNADDRLSAAEVQLGRNSSSKDNSSRWQFSAVLGAIALTLAAWWKRRLLRQRWTTWLRWRRATTPAAKVQAAWSDVADAAANKGVTASVLDTDRDLARLIEQRLLPSQRVSELATMAERATFAPVLTTDLQASAAKDLSVAVVSSIADVPPYLAGLSSGRRAHESVNA
jgi:uncharacterized protein (DUF58 family)/transglutaminase-like putative cysteine protease